METIQFEMQPAQTKAGEHIVSGEQITQALQLMSAAPKKPVMEAPEILYAEQCAGNQDLATDEAYLYVWNDSYWQLQTDNEAKRDALKWLQSNNRARATEQTAKSCYKTALLLTQQMPPKPDRIVVPAGKQWFVLDEFGWSVESPDRKVGITHGIRLNARPFPGYYTPAPVPPDSLFGRYLNTSLPDLAVRELVQEYIGYTLCNMNLQCAQLWIGNGSNGKSVMLNIARALHEKAVAMRLDKLDGFDLTSIVGASLAICDETPKAKINQQALKSLISQGYIDINPKYKAAFSYKPIAKWIICGNHMPAIDDYSDGWWRRFHIINWNVQVKGKDIIHGLDQKIIRDELHIVLDWALAGLSRLVERGDFQIPDSVEQAKQEAKADSNTVTSWIWSMGVVLDADAKTTKKALYESYCEHCEQKGFPACNEAQFFKRLNGEIPGIKNERIMVREGGKKHRAYCVNLAVGRFDDEPTPPQSDELEDDPFKV
ncbi:hypothetical protein CY652_19110 [Burkholderia sp. WAC0059]|uniref:DNA primase family protein n=1 Tax=Burkholderia sp. WAC0059 TaxID=2066022 RepID=UPI000C7EBD59|nr:phage/plasmid primase, P4 family [Burkholderia sp. WAC0059]PLZ00774.1 hypothetical protein CY652_19110 [Burkholderia sp. WAC0059]